MSRYCYFNKILPGKSEFIKDYYRDKSSNSAKEKAQFFRDDIGVKSFNSWIQKSGDCEYYLRCVETIEGVS